MRFHLWRKPKGEYKGRTEGRQRGKIHTPLQILNLLQRIPLLLRPLLQLRNLNLLAKFLEISLFPRFSSGFFARSLINKLLLDLAHVFIALDHFCEVICWS